MIMRPQPRRRGRFILRGPDMTERPRGPPNQHTCKDLPAHRERKLLLQDTRRCGHAGPLNQRLHLEATGHVRARCNPAPAIDETNIYIRKCLESL
jgi:hypothetical protein